MGNLSLAIACKVATTHAAPPISPRISSIPSDFFKLIPPESNVIPLPGNGYYFVTIIQSNFYCNFNTFLGIEKNLINGKYDYCSFL